ncbi:MAG: 5'/3'-nucleotidase SurE [Anaerolineaceae bacterium]|nr:5'/3'-nucleotidase SurE [Anaerolineaceae bacterium]
MQNKPRPRILICNDDGIHSPGLKAAAEALQPLGELTIVAPRDQYSGAGRSYPHDSDGHIDPVEIEVNNQKVIGYAVGGSPAQAVLHAFMEIMDEKPHLVVSGINYGENIGWGITVSGTIGSAMEGADFGVPALAVSLQLLSENFLEYENIDFSSAGYFTRLFSERVLKEGLPSGVDLLKIEVPADATQQTGWQVTRLLPDRYFRIQTTRKGSWKEVKEGKIIGKPKFLPGYGEDTDGHVLIVDKQVSVTPLKLDMTAPVDFDNLTQHLMENSEK